MPPSDDDDPIRLRHEGHAIVSGGPADLGATAPGDVVDVPADAADHYREHHGFVYVYASDAVDEMDYGELRELAGRTDGVNGNQSADDLREQLAEYHADTEESA